MKNEYNTEMTEKHSVFSLKVSTDNRIKKCIRDYKRIGDINYTSFCDMQHGYLFTTE